MYAAYRLPYTEYERGWGQRHFDYTYHRSKEDALSAAKKYNLKHNNEKKVPDWYVVPDIYNIELVEISKEIYDKVFKN